MLQNKNAISINFFLLFKNIEKICLLRRIKVTIAHKNLIFSKQEFCHVSFLQHTVGIVNNELRNVNEWCRANKLSLNLSKSNFLVIPPRLRKPRPYISLKLNNIEINLYENVK